MLSKVCGLQLGFQGRVVSVCGLHVTNLRMQLQSPCRSPSLKTASWVSTTSIGMQLCQTRAMTYACGGLINSNHTQLISRTTIFGLINSRSNYYQGDPAPKYGRALATKVAEHLLEGNQIVFEHRDYCGTAFFFFRGKFLYCEAYDGGWTGDHLKEFPTKELFVAWLADQDDVSMSGVNDGLDDWRVNNQRITQRRLEDAVC
eukprot:c12848_g2_i1.p1 GENE.c12848_g2_i1~~c12848_g2_i1.p1  ORF type:complete len:202 (-),score=32.48 c12848_g2_i1:504-1109(-)